MDDTADDFDAVTSADGLAIVAMLEEKFGCGADVVVPARPANPANGFAGTGAAVVEEPFENPENPENGLFDGALVVRLTGGSDPPMERLNERNKLRTNNVKVRKYILTSHEISCESSFHLLKLC